MCTRPIVVTYSARLNKNTDSDIKVYGEKHSVLCQCGKCEECLKQYQNDWSVRCYYELKRSNVAVFFTLTYREDSVHDVFDEETGERFTSVCKNDVQLFLKRIREARRKRGDSTDFKYFITSEYGPTTLRSHYHGLLFFVNKFDFAEFAADWNKKFGFVTFREISLLNSKSALNSIRYAAKYSAKGAFENPFIMRGFVEPTFHLISKNLGSNYLTDERKRYHLALDYFPRRFAGKYTDGYLEEIRRRLVVYIDGFPYHLPRYYREKIFAKRKDLQVAYSDYVCQRVIALNAPTLVRLSTDKPYRTASKAVYEEYMQNVRASELRCEDARHKHSKFFTKSKI